MAGIAGLLGINDSTRKLVSIGEQVLFDVATQYLAAHNADLAAATRIFVEGETEAFKTVYKLPGGGRLQRRGSQAPSGAVKTSGSWDTSYPLEDFGAQYGASDVDFAYMTVNDLQLQMDTIRTQDMNTVRFEMLRALYNNTARTFKDPQHGTLTVQPVANGDAVVYPPVIGSETEATDDHFRVSGYAASGISDTNNPYDTLRDELEEHTGTPTGYGNIAVFINPAQLAKTEALSDYEPVSDVNIRAGQDSNVPINLPNVPGRIVGRTNGVWVVVWRWTPANYMKAVDLDSPGPLMLRRDPADTGLGSGLQLVAKDAVTPIQTSHYRHRFGFGAGNRLGAALMFLDAGSTWTIPTTYA